MASVRKAGIARVAVVLGETCAWLFALALGVTVFEVLMRYLFKSPTTWAHETTTALCAIAFIFGGAYSMAREEHMRVTSILERVSGRVRRSIEWLSIACGAIYLAALGWGAWLQARESLWRFEGTAWVPEPLPGPPGWPLPALVKGALLAGTLLFLAVLVAYAIRYARTGQAQNDGGDERWN